MKIWYRIFNEKPVSAPISALGLFQYVKKVHHIFCSVLDIIFCTADTTVIMFRADMDMEIYKYQHCKNDISLYKIILFVSLIL